MKKLSNFSTIILISLLVIGAFFRFYLISSQSYWMDESISVSTIQNIQQGNSSYLYSGDYYPCPLYCYPTAALANYIGNNPLTYRFEAALFGILFIYIIFLVGKNLFDTETALLSSFFVTFSYSQIAWSRQVRWYTLLECFFWLSILFFHLAIKEQKSKQKFLYIFLTIFCTLLAMISHAMGYFLPIIFLCWFIYENHNKSSKRNLLISLCLIAVTFSIYLLINTLRGFENIFPSINEIFYWRFLLPQYAAFYLKKYWIFIVFSIFSLFHIEKNKLDNAKFLSFIFSFVLIYTSLFRNDFNYSHIFPAVPALYLLGSLGMVTVYRKITLKQNKIIFSFFILLFFFALQGGVICPKQNYFLESDNPNLWPRLTQYSFIMQPDYNSTYAYIKQNIKADDVVISPIPQLSKVFLDEPGYWLKFISDRHSFEKNGHDVYVGSIVVHDLNELTDITSKHHGYIIVSETFKQNFLDASVVRYIIESFKNVYYKKTGDNEVWVYQF